MARKNSRRISHRAVSKTALLIVGEGADDQAFINHMNRQFRAENASIRSKIEKQSGGSPGNIIRNATRKYKDRAYDQRFLVLDSDIQLTQPEYDRARQSGYRVILWSPVCLEGALLDVLGDMVSESETARQLKDRLHPRLAGNHTQPEAYATLFPKPVLESSDNASVNTVRKALSGQLD